MTANIFEVASKNVQVTNRNLGDERHGDQIKDRLDLDMAWVVTPKDLEQLSLNEQDAPNYQTLLFGSEGSVKNVGFEKIPFTREFDNHVVAVDLLSGQRQFLSKRLRKFAAKVIPGNQIELTFQAQFQYETADELWFLSNLNKRTNEMAILRPAQMDIEESEDEENNNTEQTGKDGENDSTT